MRRHDRIERDHVDEREDVGGLPLAEVILHRQPGRFLAPDAGRRLRARPCVPENRVGHLVGRSRVGDLTHFLERRVEFGGTERGRRQRPELVA